MKTIVLNEGEGERLWFYGGGVHTWKVTAEDTQGQVGIFEDVLERGKTTPLHTHPESDEIVYVLEGEILVHDAGNPRTVRAGSVVINQRGVLPPYASSLDPPALPGPLPALPRAFSPELRGLTERRGRGGRGAPRG